MQAAAAVRRQSIGVLLLSNLVVASCAIIYELLIGVTWSYLQGASIILRQVMGRVVGPRQPYLPIYELGHDGQAVGLGAEDQVVR